MGTSSRTLRYTDSFSSFDSMLSRIGRGAGRHRCPPRGWRRASRRRRHVVVVDLGRQSQVSAAPATPRRKRPMVCEAHDPINPTIQCVGRTPWTVLQSKHEWRWHRRRTALQQDRASTSIQNQLRCHDEGLRATSQDATALKVEAWEGHRAGDAYGKRDECQRRPCSCGRTSDEKLGHDLTTVLPTKACVQTENADSTGRH